MKLHFLALLVPVSAVAGAANCPVATNVFGTGVTYRGTYANEVEGFLGIRFAKDTGGPNRFKPPRAYVPSPKSIIDASQGGAACPQALNLEPPDPWNAYSYVRNISEDCLRLNVWRPNGTKAGDKLPVLVYIYGGSFVEGTKDGLLSQPGGMILQAKAHGQPIMNVEMNYRLGSPYAPVIFNTALLTDAVFGFAQSGALAREGSQNAGIRDQRLALEWVYQNIAAFGGDPNKITIHGQSSGGLAVGMQILAYGGSRPYPFQQAIAQSQALDLAITDTVTRDSMDGTRQKTKCNNTPLDSTATLKCLRNLPMQTLLDAQLDYNPPVPGENDLDAWLPVVDGDILPDAPSKLLAERRFAKNMRTMIGWAQDDGSYFVPENVTTPQDTYEYIHEYTPHVSPSNLKKLLALYPSSEYGPTYYPNGTLEVDAEWARVARITRDMLFVCQPILIGQALAAVGNTVYFYNQNSTMLGPALHHDDLYGFGVVHESELIYVFGNISKYDIPGWGYSPTAEDYRLQTQESGSWASFTVRGEPSVQGDYTLQGWKPADFNDPNFGTFVIGGPSEGYSGRGGNPTTRKLMAAQRLQERCNFLNSPELVQQLRY